VGGRRDPYRDTVPRLVENLPADRARGPTSPWCHQHPDRDLPPGPATGFLQETPRWWDRRRKPTGTNVPGRDPGMSHRPDRGVINDPGPGSLADPGPGVMEQPPAAGWVTPSGPPPQSHSPRGQVIARVCDVAADGSSTLVPRGALDLPARYDPDQAVSWNPGSEAGFTSGPAGGFLELPLRAGKSDPHSARVRSTRSVRPPRPEPRRTSRSRAGTPGSRRAAKSAATPGSSPPPTN
jgi:hypothetical protein